MQKAVAASVVTDWPVDNNAVNKDAPLEVACEYGKLAAGVVNRKEEPSYQNSDDSSSLGGAEDSSDDCSTLGLKEEASQDDTERAYSLTDEEAKPGLGEGPNDNNQLERHKEHMRLMPDRLHRAALFAAASFPEEKRSDELSSLEDEQPLLVLDDGVELSGGNSMSVPSLGLQSSNVSSLSATSTSSPIARKAVEIPTDDYGRDADDIWAALDACIRKEIDAEWGIAPALPHTQPTNNTEYGNVDRSAGAGSGGSSYDELSSIDESESLSASVDECLESNSGASGLSSISIASSHVNGNASRPSDIDNTPMQDADVHAGMYQDASSALVYPRYWEFDEVITATPFEPVEFEDPEPATDLLEVSEHDDPVSSSPVGEDALEYTADTSDNAASFHEDAFVGFDDLWGVFAEHLPNRSSSFLDIGCGTSHVCRNLVLHGYNHVYGIDISTSKVAFQTQENHELLKFVQFQEMDATAMNFPDQFFDCAFSKATLDVLAAGSHNSSVLPTLTEIHRCVKPGGLWIVVSCQSRDRSNKTWLDENQADSLTETTGPWWEWPSTAAFLQQHFDIVKEYGAGTPFVAQGERCRPFVIRVYRHKESSGQRLTRLVVQWYEGRSVARTTSAIERWQAEKRTGRIEGESRIREMKAMVVEDSLSKHAARVITCQLGKAEREVKRKTIYQELLDAERSDMAKEDQLASEMSKEYADSVGFIREMLVLLVNGLAVSPPSNPPVDEQRGDTRTDFSTVNSPLAPVLKEPEATVHNFTQFYVETLMASAQQSELSRHDSSQQNSTVLDLELQREFDQQMESCGDENNPEGLSTSEDFAVATEFDETMMAPEQQITGETLQPACAGDPSPYASAVVEAIILRPSALPTAVNETGDWTQKFVEEIIMIAVTQQCGQPPTDQFANTRSVDRCPDDEEQADCVVACVRDLISMTVKLCEQPVEDPSTIHLQPGTATKMENGDDSVQDYVQKLLTDAVKLCGIRDR
ncbi:hypothetical protein BBJ28_00021378 [Nothophytophthora sp. Chile5]|nr:hypothetical protein BBJ28_00021378 [Nothophytophthora sp. Chile5]